MPLMEWQISSAAANRTSWKNLKNPTTKQKAEQITLKFTSINFKMLKIVYDAHLQISFNLNISYKTKYKKR